LKDHSCKTSVDSQRVNFWLIVSPEVCSIPSTFSIAGLSLPTDRQVPFMLACPMVFSLFLILFFPRLFTISGLVPIRFVQHSGGRFFHVKSLFQLHPRPLPSIRICPFIPHYPFPLLSSGPLQILGHSYKTSLSRVTSFCNFPVQPDIPLRFPISTLFLPLTLPASRPSFRFSTGFSDVPPALIPFLCRVP